MQSRGHTLVVVHTTLQNVVSLTVSDVSSRVSLPIGTIFHPIFEFIGLIIVVMEHENSKKRSYFPHEVEKEHDYRVSDWFVSSKIFNWLITLLLDKIEGQAVQIRQREETQHN